MNDPVHIYGEKMPEGTKTPEQIKAESEARIAESAARNQNAARIILLVALSVIALGIVTPFVILLGRLAGGW